MQPMKLTEDFANQMHSKLNDWLVIVFSLINFNELINYLKLGDID